MVIAHVCKVVRAEEEVSPSFIGGKQELIIDGYFIIWLYPIFIPTLPRQ